MFHRGFALLAVLAITPAHATLVEYAFTARVDGFTSIATVRVFGLNPNGDTVTGGFIFDDAAPMTSHEEHQFGDYPVWYSSSTYDMSNLQMWVNVGDYLLTVTGGGVSISDAPAFGPWCTCGPDSFHDRWSLSASGDGNEVNGHTVRSITMSLLENLGRPLTSSELQVADPAQWSNDISNRSFRIGFADTGMSGYLTSITPTTTSVPEPATLSLLAVGALGALAARRRRHVAANA